MTQDVSEEKTQPHISVRNFISKDRVIGFSDAIFAFAATLLVLKLDLPNIPKTEIANQFPTVFSFLLPQYMANIISFLVIGYYWLNHHVIFSLVEKIDQRLVWINLVFLISISFLPFPVDLYGDIQGSPMILMFYSASLAVCGFLLLIMWLYVSQRNRLISKDMTKSDIAYHSLRYAVAPVVFTCSVPLAFFDPIISQLSWVFVIIGVTGIEYLFKKKHQ